LKYSNFSFKKAKNRALAVFANPKLNGNKIFEDTIVSSLFWKPSFS